MDPTGKPRTRGIPTAGVLTIVTVAGGDRYSLDREGASDPDVERILDTGQPVGALGTWGGVTGQLIYTDDSVNELARHISITDIVMVERRPSRCYVAPEYAAEQAELARQLSALRVYVTRDCKGVYPVGCSAVVVARDGHEALRLLGEALAAAGAPQAEGSFTIEELDITEAAARVLTSGDY